METKCATCGTELLVPIRFLVEAQIADREDNQLTGFLCIPCEQKVKDVFDESY